MAGKRDLVKSAVRHRKSIRAVPPTMPPPPRIMLMVRPEVIRSIAAACAASSDDETGGPLIGTLQPSWDGDRVRFIVAVLGTIDPGPDLSAGPASVGLGKLGDGERAASALRWWRGVTGLDLRHLGDWHKHPSGSPCPSGGDRETARRMHANNGASPWLTAIAVCERHEAENLAPNMDGNACFTIMGSSSGEVAFYRADGQTGLARVATRVEADAIPRLPGMPWHVSDPARFAAECRLLKMADLGVAIESVVSDGRPMLVIRLQPEHGSPVTIITKPDYPLAAPEVMDDRGRSIPVRGWGPARFLVDVALEAAR